MSEFIAEAQILVRPNTTGFRAELEAALASAIKPIEIPVVPVAATGFAAATAATTGLTAATGEATVATQALAAATEKEAIAAVTAAEAETIQARTLGTVARGAGAATLSMVGLRAATLAASGPFIIGTVAVVAFAKAVESAAALETELNVFKVTAGATADEMARVSAEAKQLGRDLTLPGITASDAATALTELSKAGLSVRDSMNAARGTLQLATAAQISNAEAAKLVSSALNSFQLDGTQAVKVADLFAGAAKAAQGSIQDFGPALAQASAVAHAFGLSIGDTVTLLTELAKAGLQGGRAGTSLRVALLRLVNPPAEAAKALKELNIQIRDAEGNVRPQVFTDIETALKGVSKAQRQATEAVIFGSDAVRTQIILGQQGAAAFNEISKAVNESGLAQQQASARTKGLQGDFSNLSNQVQSLGLTLGQVATGPVSAFVKSLANTVSEMALAADGAVALAHELRNIGDSVPGSGVLGPFRSTLVKVAEVSNPLTLQLKLAAAAAKQFGVDAQDSGSKLSVFEGIAKSATDTMNGLADAIAGAAARTKAQQPQLDAGLNVKQIQNVIGGFDANKVRDQIAGDNQKLLDDLQTEQDFLKAQLQRQFVKNRPELKRAIEQALLGTVNDIDAIQKQATSKAAKAKSDAEKAARDAAAAVTAREQALLTQFGVARDQQQNKIAAAAQTKGLQDDIKAEQGLKALVLKQIAAVKERVSVEGGRAAALASLRAILIQINGQTKSLIEEQQAAREQQRQNLIQSATLDIDFAQITGNQQAEINARKKLISQLKAQQALVKKGTLEYKELRNQIAEQNAAIEAIAAEKKKQNNLNAQASFEFLQTQQGFASNLLGNLIPGGATSGLVGGGTGSTSPVQTALTPVADTSGKSGPTSGQANATNHILTQILGQLKAINGTTQAPEAHQWRAWQNGVMDGVGGG